MSYPNRYRSSYRANYAKPSSPRVLTSTGEDAGYSVKQQSYLLSLADSVQALLAEVDASDSLFTSTLDVIVPLVPSIDAVRASQRVESVSSAIDALKGLVERVKAARAPQIAAEVVAQHPGLPVTHRPPFHARFSRQGGCDVCGADIVEGVDWCVEHAGRQFRNYCCRCADETPAERSARQLAAHEAAQAALAERRARAAAEEQARLDVLDRISTVRALFGHGPDSKATVGAAIPSLGHNDLDFIVIKSNRVLRTIGGRDDQPLAPAQAITLLDRIIAMSSDERAEAAVAYGREIGSCGRCGRHLTDKASRDAGLGPDCASKTWL